MARRFNGAKFGNRGSNLRKQDKHVLFVNSVAGPRIVAKSENIDLTERTIDGKPPNFKFMTQAEAVEFAQGVKNAISGGEIVPKDPDAYRVPDMDNLKRVLTIQRLIQTGVEVGSDDHAWLEAEGLEFQMDLSHVPTKYRAIYGNGRFSNLPSANAKVPLSERIDLTPTEAARIKDFDLFRRWAERKYQISDALHLRSLHQLYMRGLDGEVITHEDMEAWGILKMAYPHLPNIMQMDGILPPGLDGFTLFQVPPQALLIRDVCARITI